MAERSRWPAADHSPRVQPEEIARILLFHCSEAAREISRIAILDYDRA